MKSKSRIPPEPIGWPLLPVPQDGALKYPTLADSIRQSIRIILLTRPGERLMRPEFGAGLENFLHEPNTLITRRRIRDRIAQSLDAWEPRISVHRIDIWEDELQPDKIRIEIAYLVRRTGTLEQISLNMTFGDETYAHSALPTG